MEPSPNSLEKSFFNPVVDYQKATGPGNDFISTSMARVLCIYTGGTIGMKATDDGYIPAENWFFDTLKSSPKFHTRNGGDDLFRECVKFIDTAEQVSCIELPCLVSPKSVYGKQIQYCILEYQPLLDSANMTSNEWIKIAGDIELNYNVFDAFIVLHGTDTMSYTASALSFMFQDLGKSVILTGSQVPLSEWRTDAEENLLGALFLAGHFVIPEVGVFFGNKLFRGNRVTKVDALDFLAFDSPNLKPLATMGVNVDVNWKHVRRPNTTSRFKVYKSLSKKVASLKLYPGISLNALSATLDSGIQGLVLETFGAGNSPSNRKDLLERIAKACDDGIIIINCTQCRRGMVSDLYETGKALSKIGVVSGSDMTPECAFTKLCYVLVLDISYEAKRNMCSKNLRGELTVLPSNLNDKAKFRSQFIEAVVDSMGFSSPIERNIVERALLPQIISSALLTKDHTFFEHLCNYSENISSLVNIGDFQGRSALYYAAFNGSVSTAKKLLDLGANVHQRTFLGETVLGCACSHAHHDVAWLLFQSGGNFDRDDHVSIYHFQRAAIYGDIRHVSLYLQCGFDVNTKLAHNQTALHLAYIYNQLELIELLLSSEGIDQNCVDIFGKKPFEYEAGDERFSQVRL